MISIARSTIFAAIILLSTMPALAQSGDAILILDASGSMWGQVDGQTKISAARKAVDSILLKWKPADRLGLMTYGHRSKGDCKDIELMVPVSRFDPDRIKAAVNGLNPKGKTPIADSLRAAAGALRSTENKATVVLVSDGIETCAPDPCAVAAELKKAGVNFTAHVIGFDVADPAAKSQLQCIARATGGVYLDARNASGLEDALGRAVAAVQGSKVQSEAPAKPAADPYQGKNIRGVARLAAGLDPITDNNANVRWAFYKPQGDEKGDLVTIFYNAPFADTIAAGDYLLEVTYGEVTRSQPVKVERGKPLGLDVVLDAGYVTSDGSVIGATSKADNLTWEIIDGQGDVMVTDYATLPKFILPAGNYTLRLSKGHSKSEKDFTLAAGDSVNVSLSLDMGRLLVSGVYTPGGQKAERGFTVEVRLPPKSDTEAGDHVQTSYDPVSQFDLPSGSYDVIASVGVASRMTRVEIRTGTPTRIDVDLNAGVAAIKTGSGTFLEVVTPERDINNDRKSVYTSFEKDEAVTLSAGKYVVVVEYEGGTKVEKEFTVTAGRRVEVTVTK